MDNNYEPSNNNLAAGGYCSNSDTVKELTLQWISVDSEIKMVKGNRIRKVTLYTLSRVQEIAEIKDSWSQLKW